MKTKRPFLSGYKTYDTSNGYGDAREWRAAFAAAMGLDEARQRVGKRSPFEILGLVQPATWPAVVNAYRTAAMDCHPDRCAVHGLTIDEATERFKSVVAAYTLLKSRYRV